MASAINGRWEKARLTLAHHAGIVRSEVHPAGIRKPSPTKCASCDHPLVCNNRCRQCDFMNIREIKHGKLRR